MDCKKCKWFVDAYIPLTHDEKEYMRLKKKYEGVMVTFDKRVCCLGCCDGSRFEREER